MADNTRIAVMAGGDLIATDDIAGVKHQRVKVGHGADGTYADASPDTPLPVGVASGTALGTGRATVAVAGTRVQLAAHAAISVTVRASVSNTGLVYVGGPDVTAGNGYELAPGEAVSMDLTDTAAVYLDAATGGAVVTYLWVTP